VDKALCRQLIELLVFEPLGFAAMGSSLTLAQLFEHANLPIGFNQRLAAALGFGLNLSDLSSQRSPLRRQGQLKAMRLQQGIHIGGTGQFKAPRFFRSRGLLSLDHLIFRAEHFFRPQRLGQIGAALIAFGDAQSQEGFEAEAEIRH